MFVNAMTEDQLCDTILQCRTHAFLFALRMLRNEQDAEDAVQSASLKAFRGREGFRGDCAPSSWYFAIVKREALMIIRKHALRDQVATTESLDEKRQMTGFDVPHHHTPELAAMVQEKLVIAEEFIERLCPSQKQAIRMAILQAGTGRLGERSVFTPRPGKVSSMLKVNLFRARKQLRFMVECAELEEVMTA